MVSVIHPLLINPWFTPTPLFDRITKVFMKCLVHALQLSLRIRGDRWDRGQLGGYSRTSHRPSRILPWAGPPFTRHGQTAFYPGPGRLLPSTAGPPFTHNQVSGCCNLDFSEIVDILRVNGLNSYIETFKGILLIDVHQLLLIQCI